MVRKDATEGCHETGATSAVLEGRNMQVDRCDLRVDRLSTL